MWAVNLEAAKLQMIEALRIGKCPWCCCALTEQYVFGRMNPMVKVTKVSDNTTLQEGRFILYPQETFEESQKRWLEEGVIDKKQSKKAMEQL